MIILVRTIILLTMTVSLLAINNACTLQRPKANNVQNEIDRALKVGISDNQKLKAKNRRALPASVQNALMPQPAIQPQIQSSENEALENHFNVSVTEVSAKDFYLGLVKGTPYNMIVSPDVTGTITLNLNDVTIPQVMEAVRDAYGYEYEKTSYGYQIFPRQLETKIFHLNYLNIDRKGTSQTTIGSGQITRNIQGSSTGGTGTTGGSSTSKTTTSSSGSVETKTDSTFWKLIKDNLDTLIGSKDGRYVTVNPDSGTITVRAFPNELRKIAKYFDDIQGIINRQVILEAKVLEIQLDAQYQTGINWKILGLQFGTFDTTQNFSDNLPNFNSMFTLNMSKGGTFNSVIQLLSSQGRVNVLSSPRISTINNQKAIIKVGDDRFFVTNVSSETTTPALGAGQVAANIEFTPFFSGISLDVTPQIDEEGNVTLHIHPLISTVTQDNQNFVVNGQTQNIPLASSKVRESDSIVRAKNGQVIVLGGLMANQSYDNAASTPGADKLPEIGGLFKRSNLTSQKYELVILLRPIVIESTETWQKRLKNASVRFKEMQGSFEYNLNRTTTPEGFK